MKRFSALTLMLSLAMFAGGPEAPSFRILPLDTKTGAALQDLKPEELRERSSPDIVENHDRGEVERTVERPKGELDLTSAQVEALRGEIQAITAVTKASAQSDGVGPSSFRPSGFRVKLHMRIGRGPVRQIRRWMDRPPSSNSRCRKVHRP